MEEVQCWQGVSVMNGAWRSDQWLETDGKSEDSLQENEFVTQQSMNGQTLMENLLGGS